MHCNPPSRTNKQRFVAVANRGIKHNVRESFLEGNSAAGSEKVEKKGNLVYVLGDPSLWDAFFLLPLVTQLDARYAPWNLLDPGGLPVHSGCDDH